MEKPESGSVSAGARAAAAAAAAAGRSGIRPWSAAALSVLLSAAAVVAVGGVCALTYPILKELRAERVRGENGAEEKVLGFWSITMLSVLVGCICSIFSWTLTYFASYKPETVFPAPLATTHFRDGAAGGFHIGYGVAVLNGIMAMITVIWNLN
ncbi:ADP-ribosylation factor-like protein 6-interacting protein 6 [Betta splendens]|uniref:ADP-ribosylation factor-like protein 6-interacting protein 6 n=1 Tax=Betta splendens TaxID=158456 RepID=A0A6P7PQH4_BETSP|nr:ADP-ribosylation factor-like protein 6-interacting protein 6 [Betta splendens]